MQFAIDISGWIDIYLNQILDIQIFNVTTVPRYLGPGV